ncbi:MAG: hypothetical protein L6R28_06715 [Planctomycetes bacterium]|nr:hypothetical protein [Planctomycetota bacterium]
MRSIEPKSFGPSGALVARALEEGRPHALAFGEPVPDAKAQIEAFTLETLAAGRVVQSKEDASCLLAGLWLFYDYFDASHTIAQGIKTESGSYWHAIQHRMEPDASNSRYWFSRVGEHPVFAELAQDAQEIAANHPQTKPKDLPLNGKAWDPDAFVLCCTRTPDAATEKLLLAIQQRECLLLFEHNYRKAFL